MLHLLDRCVRLHWGSDLAELADSSFRLDAPALQAERRARAAGDAISGSVDPLERRDDPLAPAHIGRALPHLWGPMARPSARARGWPIEGAHHRHTSPAACTPPHRPASVSTSRPSLRTKDPG